VIYNNKSKRACTYIFTSTGTNYSAEDEPVGGLPAELLLVDVAAEQLDVATAAVEVLLVLHGELQHQGLVLIAELRVLRRDGVEPVVLRRLDACARSQKQRNVLISNSAYGEQNKTKPNPATLKTKILL
jgi:hypothetical protein